MRDIKGEKSKVLNKRSSTIVIKNSRTGEIQGEIKTKETQYGTPTLKFKENPTLKAFGDARFYAGLSGSLTRLTDGRSYLVAGSGISISSGSNDQVVITAGSINPADTLTFGDGFNPHGAVYNGTAPISVSLLAKANGGLGVNSSGNFISPGNLPSTAGATTSWELIVSDGSTAYRSTINSILSLGVSAGVTLSNPLTLNSAGGIRDTLGSSQYDNSTIVDLALKLESNKGLETTTSGLKIDPSNLTSTTVDANDKVLIGDISDSDNIKYVTAQSLANLASIGTLTNTLNIGAGLNPSGSNFDGSTDIDVEVLAADSTISVASSGISVLKVPNSASNGNGISSFTFDGSAGATISAQTTANRGLQVTTSGIELDIDNLPSAYAETDDYLLIYDISNAEERKTSINNFRSDVILSLDNTFSGINVFTSGLSGSLTQLSDGKSYLVAGENITIVSESNGQITISAVASPVTGSITNITQADPGVVTTLNDHNLSEAQVVTITSVLGMTEVNGNSYYVDVLTSDTFALYSDITLSTTVDTTGFTAYISDGEYVGSTPGTANVDAPYVTWQSDSDFTNERVLTGSNGISIINDSTNMVVTTSPTKLLYNLTGSLPQGYILTVPGINFQDNGYDYHKTDVYLNGNLLISGTLEDYILGSGASDLYFNFDLLDHDSLLFKLS